MSRQAVLGLPVGRATPIRVVSVATSVWLLGTWGVVHWIDSSLPAARWMGAGMAVGLWLVWPIWRLSMDWGRAGGGGLVEGDGGGKGARASRVIAEWACIGLVFQVVVWPLRVVAGWSVEEALMLSGWVLGWGLWGAAAVAWGAVGRARGWATGAAAAWMAVLFGPAAARVLGGVALPAWADAWAGLAWLGPTGEGGADGWAIVAVWASGLLVWAAWWAAGAGRGGDGHANESTSKAG
ncbi:MAG: hypothetical protein AAF823_14495 [Planctomycetota bacterium]